MPRYVILEHDWPTRHWDLLLAAGDVLKAWRLSEAPSVGRTVPAEPNADHRLHYLEYEGPVTDGRGTVVRWDRGTYEGKVMADEWEVAFAGEVLVGIGRMTLAGFTWEADQIA